MDHIIQLKIILERTKPSIWRRIQVEKQTTYFEMHHIIQIAMGWKNYHMYEFDVDGYKLGEPFDEMDDVDDDADVVVDARTMTLESLIVESKEEFEYLYDFGDNWRHKIVVEKFLPKGRRTVYPKCTGGKLACPPEDCGSIRGFYGLLDIIKNKNHPERRETLTWLGRGYDPEHFNKELVNEKLFSLDEYINEWLNN